MEKKIEELKKEFKLLCKNILNDEIPREMLKAFAYSYIEILKNKNN
tara:strand:+ start:601 stop:738 length:138 start_codon:yes stop_codon:yes gene_type:complete